MIDNTDAGSPFAVFPTPYAIRFPRSASSDQGDFECVEVRLDGRWERVRLDDKERILSLPGLHEQLFTDVLHCRGPKRLVALLDRVLAEQGVAASHLDVVDLNAGAGTVAEELRRLGVGTVVGVDDTPAARAAAERDRWGIYDDYLAADLTNASSHELARLVATDPNVLIASAVVRSDEVNPRTFAATFNVIRSSGWVALNLDNPFGAIDAQDAMGRLVRAMLDRQIVQVEATERYVHRLDTQGRRIESLAVVVRKLCDLPDDLLNELAPATAMGQQTRGMIEFKGEKMVPQPGASNAPRRYRVRQFASMASIALLLMTGTFLATTAWMQGTEGRSDDDAAAAARALSAELLTDSATAATAVAPATLSPAAVPTESPLTAPPAVHPDKVDDEKAPVHAS